MGGLVAHWARSVIARGATGYQKTHDAPKPLCLKDLPTQLLRHGRARKGQAPLLENPVDEAVLNGFFPVHEAVTVRILLDTLDALARVFGQNLIEAITGLEHLLGMD